MRSLPDPGEVERRLRRVSQLRLLFRRLPHVATPAESALLERYQRFRSGATHSIDLPALRAGILDDWRGRRFDSIVQVAGKVPDALYRADRDIVTYITISRLRIQARGE